MIYRPDIDGVRAIAVMVVLLFHFGFSYFPGGYVGVDIFFVISGFLITRLIKDAVEAGEFRFGDFYLRRARRLFPAFFVTAAVTFCFAVLMFSPEHMQRFGGELLYSLTSISNFYFWAESGYFDAGSNFKPLLHTWSLSVEEQFYIFWPFLIFFGIKKFRSFGAFVVVCFLGFLSFILNLVFQGGGDFLKFISPTISGFFTDGGATIYFLTPFRVFEFAIGAILVWVVNFVPKRNWILELLLCIGFVLALAPVFFYDDKLLFPSYYALVPCFGAALLIYAGQARYLGKLLSNPVSVRIGLISYSLYLVHWPVYVFYRYYIYGELTTLEKYGVLASSFVLAFFLYRFVEVKYRRPKLTSDSSSAAVFGLLCAFFAIVLIVPAATAWANGGWVGRAKHLVVNLNEIKCESGRECVLQEGNKGRVVFVGDSHMGHHIKTILGKFPGYNVSYFNVSSCFMGNEFRSRDHNSRRERICLQANESLRVYLDANSSDIKYVVHAQRWHGYLNRLYIPGGKDLLGGDKVKYKLMLEDVLSSYSGLAANKIILGAAPNSLSGCIERAEFFPMECRGSGRDLLRHVKLFKEVSGGFVAADLRFIHPVDYLCKGGKCLQVMGNRKVYRDTDHLTKDGSDLVFKKIKL